MAGESVKGGAFLLESPKLEEIFVPEEFTEEQRMFAKTAEDFVKNEVAPKSDEIEAKNDELQVQLFKKAGELGLLMTDIPEKYGGLGLDKISSMLVQEKVSSGQGSFSVTITDHTGIGTLPIVYFGTEEQKQKYLPLLATGELIGSYALTETNAGSDAMGIKTKAVLSEDGKYYILNGSKQFVTNAGFADICIVYAKVDGEHHAAFIVDLKSEGITLGPEEHKMGIRGSSTRAIFLDNVKVPVENLLGEVGKGHLIAFNVLNIGRYKLGVACTGASKTALEEAVRYANQRVQFGVPISTFGMIKEKLADMVTKAYVLESAVYRTAGFIDALFSQLDYDDPEFGRKAMDAISEYATECSIIKIFGSEVLDFVVDETVQIFGGYGYTEEYPAERFYRDSRINRIFEGTNEINRLLIPGMLMRKAMKGELALLPAAQKLAKEVMTLMPMALLGSGPLAQEELAVEMTRKVALMVAGLAAQKYKEALKDQQILLARMADIIIELYAMESALLRTKKVLEEKGQDRARYHVVMTQLYVAQAFPRVAQLAQEALAAIEKGDMLKANLSILRKLTRWYTPVPLVDLKTMVADKLIEEEKYWIV
ncbi:MAG: acyl-CoA dehydrogenase [Aquificota bacterium]|nr:MAG: acyl-CoA dehydrogenase [Aquificota bacterium]